MAARHTDSGAAADPYETLAHLAVVFRRAGIPYAVGGSFPSRVRHFDDGAGGQYPVLAAEDIAVLKCVFNRPKDDADLVNLCQHYTGLDFEFVKRKLAELLGADDSRIANFEHIAAASKRIAGTECGRVDQC